MNKSKVSLLYRFLWNLSGSEISVLRNCRNDHSRHASMGLILFMTWLFASFAGGFAGYYFGGSIKLAICFGLLWGLLIYSIDRGMVISLKKDPNAEKQPFWFPFLTRAALGILIAFFISIPFEILVFNEEIIIQMDKDKDKEVLDRINSQNNIYNTSGQLSQLQKDSIESAKLDKQLLNPCPLPEYKVEVDNYNRCMSDLPPLRQKEGQLDRDYKNKLFLCPRDSFNRPIMDRSTKDARADWNAQKRLIQDKEKECIGIKRKADSISSSYFAKVRADKIDADSIIDNRNNKLTADKLKIDSVKTDFQGKLENLSGFSRRYRALNNAARNDNTLLFLMWLIRLAFFVIEVLPTIYKLKTPIGDYDRAINSSEQKFKEELALELETSKLINQNKSKAEIEIIEKTEQHRKEKEIELNNLLIDEVARVQFEIASNSLKSWEEKEKGTTSKKIDEFTKSIE
jgi:hypothetical protein